ncbi:MAG: hypothetical protein NT151_10295 [Acidobacteria bacterium]|nr:hypothetical protein [Acidobacteriota bacterium]
MKSWVLVAVAVLVASVASAQTSGAKPLPVGQVTAQKISVLSSGMMKFEKDVVWRFDGVSLHADAEETAEYKVTSALRGSAPSSLRDSLAHVRYEPLSATGTASQDPRRDWSRLRQLTGSEIVLRAQGLPARRCRLVVFEDAGLTAVDLDSPNRSTLWIARADVDEVSQWIGRRGSVAGAVLGAGVGLFAEYAFLSWAGRDGRSFGARESSFPSPSSEHQSLAASSGIDSLATIVR